jgi:MFS family permease
MVSIPTLVLSALGGAAFYAIGAFWVLECQQFFGPDAHAIARVLTAFGFAFLLGIFFGGWGIDLSRGRIREVFLISSCIATAGLAAMKTITPGASAMAIGLSFLAGIGLGGLYVPTTVVLTLVSPDEIMGAVTGLGLAMRWIGGAVGYAVYFNLFENKVTEGIHTIVGPALVKAGLPPAKVLPFIGGLLTHNSTALVALGATPTLLEAAAEAVVESYAEGFELVFLISIAFAGAAVIVSLFLKDIRRHMDNRMACEVK